MDPEEKYLFAYSDWLQRDLNGIKKSWFLSRKYWQLAHLSLLHFQMLSDTFILPCTEGIHSLCERTLKMPVLENKYPSYTVSSKDATISKPNYYFSNGERNWGGEKKGVMRKMGSGITHTKICKQKEAIQNDWRGDRKEMQKLEAWPSSSARSRFSEVSGRTDTGEALRHQSQLAAAGKQVTAW